MFTLLLPKLRHLHGSSSDFVHTPPTQVETSSPELKSISPELMKQTYDQPQSSPTHEPMEHTFEQPSTDQQPPKTRQEATTSQLMTKIGDLEKQLKETKQTFGKAILTLVDRVKTLEVSLKRKTKRLVTPSKTVNDSGGEQVEDISPTTLEAYAILTIVQKIKSVDKGKRYKRRKSSKEFVGTGLDFEEVKEEETMLYRKTKKKILQEEAGLAEAIRYRVPLVKALGKGKKWPNNFKSSYTEEDLDTIRAKLEANAKLKESMLGKDLTKLTQLKKLNFEEVKAEFEKLVKQLDTYVPMHFEATKSEDSDEANEKDDSTLGTKIPINHVPVATKITPSIHKDNFVGDANDACRVNHGHALSGGLKGYRLTLELMDNGKDDIKSILNFQGIHLPQETSMVDDDDEMLRKNEMINSWNLIFISFKKSKNLPTTTSKLHQTPVELIKIILQESIEELAKECQKPKRAKDAAYHKEKMLLYKQEEAGFQFNADQADWRDDTDDEPDDQELEAHYMYMAQLQEVTPDVADNFRPIFNSEPLQEVQNDDDHYNVIANNGEHPVQPKSVNDTYLEEQGDTNITIDSLDMSTNGETVDQDDDDLANERDLLATLIDKLNVKLMTTKTDFKNKNKSLESSYNHFKEANNELSKTNQLMFKDLKKFQDELEKQHDVNYMSKVELDYAKAKTELMSYKTESQKSINNYSYQINDLNQKISDMEKELVAHEETIAIMSQQKRIK
ncbi:hypothetical protein Tco_0623144 [Tanacetum coccineum]